MNKDASDNGELAESGFLFEIVTNVSFVYICLQVTGKYCGVFCGNR